MSDRPISLVTGAARGIGFACAQALARTAGGLVILADIDGPGVKKAAAELNGPSVDMVCDMGNPDRVHAMFDRIDAEFGSLSVLINNAGIADPGDFLETSVERFRAVIDVNLVGAFVATQRAAKSMIAAGTGGSIVNMSSINAQLAIPTVAAYCASKGGVTQLTKASALALAPYGIRVKRRRAGVHRYRDDGRGEREPGRHGHGLVANPAKAHRQARRGRRGRGVPRRR